MKTWMIRFSLIDKPLNKKSWPAVPGFDKFDAIRNFEIMMTKKLGMSKDDFKVITAQEMK